MVARGRFVTFEGGEGSGKSTQVERLAARLREAGIAVVVTREPGGTPAAEAIRRFILSGRAEPLGADGEAVLFAAARADHVDRLIRPAIERGDWVISDRFFDSTRAYQGADGAPSGIISGLERLAAGPLRPDLTVLLDIAAETGLARAARRRRGEGTADRFERDTVERHERRRQAFLDIAAAEPKRFVVIDADGPEDAVADAVWRAVEARLLATA
jgi:dTMP kinase